MSIRLPEDVAAIRRHIRNPVYDGYLADPFVFRHDNAYYAIGTGPGSDRFEFPMLRSTDLFDWEPIGFGLQRPEVEGNCFWAPEIALFEGRFYLYYSVGRGDKGHQLRVAVSSHPYGPYEDIGHPLTEPNSTPFAIDASPFQDIDGRWYLFYSRDFLDGDAESRSGTALVVAPLEGMTHLSDDYSVVMRARHDWQRYEANRSIYGGVYDWHTLEGPFTVHHKGRYYCFYSGGNWQNDTYGVDWVVASHPLGPYEDSNAGEGPRVLLTVPGRVIGPGHNSVFMCPDGAAYLAYHAWDPSMTARRMCLDLLRWDEYGPACDGPTYRDREA